MTKSISGSCLCGAVRFSVRPPTKWCGHCHCRMCQLAHGAAFVTWFGIANQQFQLNAEATLRWYQSSAKAQRGFCETCGSTLFFRSEDWPGEMHVVRACVDALDRDPAGHVYMDSHVDWVELGDQLKRLGGESGMEPLN